MAVFQLPPVPPLDPSGFGASAWQRWFDTLQRSLVAPTVSFGELSVTSLAASGGFGVNGKPPQGAVALPAAAVDPATTQALVNAIRVLLIANGQAT